MKSSWAILLAVSILKILLIPAYHSTDFEVHRNWLAITNSLPVCEWYTSDLSEWTLDYPPFFAWFELILSYPASLVDPDMVQVDNLNYASTAAVVFQRFSVIGTDIVLFVAVTRFCSSQPKRMQGLAFFEHHSERKSLAILMVTITNAGLLIVDHIHFQYNGFLLGLFILSIAYIREGQDLKGALIFACLLNFKHIFIYSVPVFTVYLFRHYCFKDEFKYQNIQEFYSARPQTCFFPGRFLLLALLVLAVCAVSFYPFVVGCGQLLQLKNRLFPWGRGLTHAYWAPNVWAIYNFADILLTKLKPVEFRKSSGFTRGLVEVTEHEMLFQITPLHCAVLWLLTQLPVLMKLWQKPHPRLFTSAVLYTTMCSYMTLWHVHEKAILMVIVPLSLIGLENLKLSRFICFFTVVCNFSLFPLLPRTQETPIKVLLLLMNYLFMKSVLDGETRNQQRVSMFAETGIRLYRMERFYLMGCMAVFLFGGLQPLLWPRFEFLPLIAYSVYCAFGMIGGWIYLYRIFNTKWHLIAGSQESDEDDIDFSS